VRHRSGAYRVWVGRPEERRPPGRHRIIPKQVFIKWDGNS